jgi:Domain of unknown function (DUF4190)/Septum formation
VTDPYAHPPGERVPPPGAPTTADAQPGAPWFPPPGYPPPQEQKTNGFAIASLVLGIIGGALLAVIFGIIALVQIPKKNQKGKGMAIAGVVLGGLWMLAIIAAIVAVVATSADRDSSTGEITESGDVSAFALEVGDCLNDIEESQMITSLPAVPCDQPHEAEVFGMFDLPEGDYPTEDELVAQADRGCADLMARYAPEAMSNPAIGFFYIYPPEQAWPEDREVVCLAISSEGTMTGSLAD